MGVVEEGGETKTISFRTVWVLPQIANPPANILLDENGVLGDGVDFDGNRKVRRDYRVGVVIYFVKRV